MSLLVYLSISILLIYSFLLILFFIGWIRHGNFMPKKPDSYPFISVVVAYRNEEKNIILLLDDLTSQNYPANRFEIILVNDHSNDRSPEMIENYKSGCKINIISLYLPDQLSGKKDAINQGIESSKGKYILTTDADCRVPENWIISFVSFIHLKGQPKFIIGLVDFNPSTGFMPWLQNLEFLSLMASGAGAAAIRKPIYCNSANLMICRDTYYAMKDPLKMNVASGDDTFLLHQIKKLHPKDTYVLKSTDATVKTDPAANLKEFVNQRIRWISKGRHYTDPHIIISSAIVILSNMTVLAWMIAAFVNASVSYILPLICKMIMDWIFMIPVLSFFSKKKLHCFIPVLSVLYPLYVVFVTIAGLFGNFTWKGRRYRSI